MGDENTSYLPEQRVKRGKAGYKGKNVEIVNADGKVVGHGTATKKSKK